MGYRIEHTAGQLQKPSPPQEEFSVLIDKKFNNNLPITKELRPILKELKGKYTQLYDLKVTSQIEDIDEKYSLMSVVKI